MEGKKVYVQCNYSRGVYETDYEIDFGSEERFLINRSSIIKKDKESGLVEATRVSGGWRKSIIGFFDQLKGEDVYVAVSNKKISKKL